MTYSQAFGGISLFFLALCLITFVEVEIRLTCRRCQHTAIYDSLAYFILIGLPTELFYTLISLFHHNNYSHIGCSECWNKKQTPKKEQ